MDLLPFHLVWGAWTCLSSPVPSTVLLSDFKIMRRRKLMKPFTFDTISDIPQGLFYVRNKVTPALHGSSWHQNCVFMLWVVASNETTIKHYSVELEFKKMLEPFCLPWQKTKLSMTNSNGKLTTIFQRWEGKEQDSVCRRWTESNDPWIQRTE